MRQESVMTDLIDLCGGQFKTGGELADLIAQIGEAHELVGRHEMTHAIRESARDECGIVGKGLRSVAGLPSARKRLRQVPVKQGDVRLDAVLEQLIDQSLIVGEPGLIRLAAALGKNTRPGQGEAIGLRAQILEQFYVFLVELVRIPGDIARFALMSFAGRVGENVPNGRAAAFYGNRALNLIGAGGATPEKIGG